MPDLVMRSRQELSKWSDWRTRGAFAGSVMLHKARRTREFVSD